MADRKMYSEEFISGKGFFEFNFMPVQTCPCRTRTKFVMSCHVFRNLWGHLIVAVVCLRIGCPGGHPILYRLVLNSKFSSFETGWHLQAGAATLPCYLIYSQRENAFMPFSWIFHEVNETESTGNWTRHAKFSFYYTMLPPFYDLKFLIIFTCYFVLVLLNY